MLKIGMLFLTLVVGSCHHPANQNTTQNKPVTIQNEPDIKSKVKETQLASKKDPVCGMPAYKFMKDTTLYKGKIYGFCGNGCKTDFLKKPTKFIH